MKITFTFLFLILINLSLVYSQSAIVIPKGNAIIVNGIISSGEWDDANSTQIVSANNKIVKVLFKHDDSSLLFAFLDNLGSANFRFPEIILDIKNDKSQTWMDDDWWFHVSSTNCYHKGKPNIYDNCKDNPPDWDANNFSVTLPDTVEIIIPYMLVGIDSNTKFIGFAFDVTNTYSAWEYFPPETDSLNPSTWATGIIEKETSAPDNINIEFIQISAGPNPFSSGTTFRYSINNTDFVQLSVYDIFGNEVDVLVYEKQVPGEYSYYYTPSSICEGLYFFRFMTGNRIESGKLIYCKN